MIRLDDAAGNPNAGGKAEVLARARRAGVPAPDGVVVLPDEEIDEKALAAALARLGGERFAVRSSADLEDRAGLSAAGVFASVIGVGRADAADAIERVRASARGEPARAYLATHGLGAARVRMAVLVQPLVEARRLGVLHTAPIEDGAVWAEERAPGEPEWGEVRPRRVALDEPLARQAAALARLVGDAADIEYAVRDDGAIVFLQARPLGALPAGRDPRRWTLPPEQSPKQSTARAWLRDAEHNPDPLSAAQASLVERLNAEPDLPRQLVLHGYLYFEETAPGSAPPAIAPEALPARFAAEIEPACDALLAPLEAATPDPSLLDAALGVYVEVARRYFGLVSPSLRAARRALDELLQCSIGEPLAAHAELLAGTGGRTVSRDAALRAIGRARDEAARAALTDRYLRDFGAYAPAWDVAVPPDDEAPARVAAAAALLARGPAPASRQTEAIALSDGAARRLSDRMSAADRGRFAALLPTVRAALTLAEDDDALFFRAQRVVRRPLAALGARLAAAGRLDGPEQVFELPIEEARAADRVDAGRARGLRAMREAARRLSPPAAIRDGVPAWRGAPPGANVIAGLGTSGRAWGRAFVLRAADADRAPPTLPPGAVLVTEAILPSLTYLLPGAAALVTDWGGALSHAATLAREYGVPAVLGTGSATRALSGGEELLVDADAGKVYRLGAG